MQRPGIRRLITLINRSRSSIEREVDDEIAFHLELRAAQLRQLGLSPDEANAEAIRRFGQAAVTPRELYLTARNKEGTMRRHQTFADVAADIVYATKGLRREPLFTAFVVLTLALGVGVNAAMFGVADRLLLRGPDHVLDPSGVHRLYLSERDPNAPSGAFTSASVGYVLYERLRNTGRSLSQVAAYKISRNGMVMDRGDAAQLITLGESTAGLFGLLGVSPVIGRFYDDGEDDTVAPHNVVVIDHGLWQRRYAGSTDVVGKHIVLGDAAYTIIGVAPRGFTGPELTRVDAWIPISIRSRNVSPEWRTTWRAQWLSVIGRLKSGVTESQAADEATQIVRSSVAERPAFSTATLSLRPISYTRRGVQSPEARISRWLVGVAAIVFLITCCNVANLLVARATRRQRELAVRIALGSGRWRLMRMLLAEGAVLAVLGGGVSLLVATWAGGVTRRVLLPDVLWSTPPVDARVFTGIAALVLGVALFAGLLPALHATRPDLSRALQAQSRGGGGAVVRLRRFLTVAQAALSVILLVGAGLFVRSLMKVQGADLGLDADRVLVVSVRQAPLASVTDTAARRAARVRSAWSYDEALQRIRLVPGVERASVAVGIPFGSAFGVSLHVAGWDSIPGNSYVSAVASDYFETVGTRVMRGRAFDKSDAKGTEPVAIVNQTMASTLWPGQDAIGRCMHIGDDNPPCARIVGIAVDARQNAIGEDPTMHYYIPYGQEVGIGGSELLVRPRGDPRALVATIRKEVLALDPSLSFVKIETMQQSIEPQVRPWRLGASLFTLMGGLALVVACVGLYAVMSYFVVQRTHEIGLRLALGSSGARVARLVLVDGMTMAAVGVVLGGAVAFVVAPYVGDLLFQTSPRDPLVFAGAAAALLTTACLAGAIPAWRARHVDPMVALRSE